MKISNKEYLVVHLTTDGVFNYETDKRVELTPEQMDKVKMWFPDLKPEDKEYGDIVLVLNPS